MLWDKLAHPLAEVRSRALRSLHFKLQHGLLDVAAPGAVPERLLDFLLAAPPPPAADALAALELLAAAAADPSTAAHLLRGGADRALIQLADETLPPVSSAATDVLGRLLTAAADAPPWQLEPTDGGGQQTSAVTEAPLPPASQQLVLWTRASPPRAPPRLQHPPDPQPAAAAASPRRPRAPPPDLEEVLARCGRRAPAAQLSEEDSQQLFEVALELAEQADQGALLAALATLRHGVLADMPAAAVAGEPALVQALLRLAAGSASGAGGSAGSPAVATAALQVLAQLAAGLAAAGEAGEGGAGMPLAPLAYQGLLRCAPLLNDATLQHEALHTALALAPLLAPPPGGSAGQPGTAVMAPLLGALSDAVRLALVAACTAADVAPPEDWASGFHALTLCPSAYGAMRLVASLLQHLPHLAGPQALPPLLCDALAALACHPVAAVAAPDLHAFALQHLPALRPAVAAQLGAAEQLRQQQAGLLTAVRQLAEAPSAALAAACCRELSSQLLALELLAQPQVKQAVGAMMDAAARHGSTPAAGALAAQLLLHPRAGMRAAALQALASAVQRHQHDGSGTFRSARPSQLLLQPAVAGCLVTRLGGNGPPQQQRLAAWLLQAAVAVDPGASGRAFLPWEPWLLCQASSPAAGPAVASVLQQVAGQKRSAWQRLAPLAQALFHASPAVAADAASQLHSQLTQLRPAAAGAMLFNPLPFDGLLAFAGEAATAAAGEAARRAGAGTHAAAYTASAAKLFTAADVQSLVGVATSRSLQPELAAAALGQLAQVAGDERFAPVLASEPVLAALLAHALDASPFRGAQQPALECLAALVGRHAAAADWLLAEADVRAVPLLQLAFHPLPAARHAAARVLHHLLFGRAARQLRALAAHVASGSSPAGSSAAAVAGSAAEQGAAGAVPEPFCALYRFPCPAAVLELGPALHPAPPASAFGSDAVQRLWRARQLCDAAAADASADSGSGSSSLVGLLEAGGGGGQAGAARWEGELVRASLATLSSLSPEGAAAEGLSQLAASQDHGQCHAALARLLLVATALPQGLTALAAAPWQDALGLLLSAAPLSGADCRLWANMLPLLQRLVAAAEPGLEHLQRLARQFAGGSALEWVRQQAAGPAAAAGGHEQAALLPAVLRAVRQVAERAQQRSSAEQRRQLLAELRAGDWLGLLPQLLQQAGYAGRVAALRLAAALVDALGSCPGPSCSAAAGDLLPATLRRVLMPRELWGTAHRHGKAAVLAALRLLLAITRAAPASEWAAAWAGVGSTYWLSRAAADSSPAVRMAALHLLAAALAVPETHSVLAQAWPDCGDVAVRAAVDDSQPAAVRAAALVAVAAALSRRPVGQPSAAAEAPEKPRDEAAAEQLADQENQQQQQLQLEEGASSLPDSLARPCSPAPASPAQASDPPPALPLPAMAAERLLQREELWTSVDAVLQDPDACNGLLRAAAAASLQRLLLDGEGAGPACSAAVLLRLLRLPTAAADAPLGQLPADQARSMQDSMQAAQTAASLVVAAAQLAPAGVWAELAASPDLLPAAAAAFSCATALSCEALPELAALEAQTLQQCSRAALAGLADAVALLAQAAVAGPAHTVLQAACECAPLPLAVAVATALNGAQQWRLASCEGSALSAACCRLLTAALQGERAAAAFLCSPDGSEHRLPLPEDACGGGAQPGTAAVGLSSHLLEQFVSTAAADEGGASSGLQQAVLHAALGGLLCSSPSAKQVALAVGLHRSLLDSCRSLAAGLGGTSAAAAPAEQPPAAARAGKLAQLKQRRAGGAGGSAAAGGRRAPAALAFGSRVPSQMAGGRASPLSQQQQAEGSSSVRQLAADAGAAPIGQPAASNQPAGERRLLLCLRLLQQLAHSCEASSDVLVEAGALEVAALLWGAGGAAVQHGLLGLLGTLLACSPAARQALASTGDPPLLERVLALVLSARPLPLATAAAAAVAGMAASPDGARVLLHTSGLPPRALRALQDHAAAKDWRRMLPTLQILADLCSQPEAQRAALACTSPSDSLPGVLLALAAPEAVAPAGAAAGQAAAAEAAMLALRQLALCPHAKAWFCSQHGALAQLLGAVGAAEQAPGRAAAAAHALWALVHGSGGERAKVALRRCSDWGGALAAAAAARERSGGAAWAPQLSQACTALQRLLA